MSLNRSEHQDMIIIFDWIRLYPELDKLIFHIPNEGKRNIVTGRRLKRSGLVAGIPDIFCAIPSDDSNGMFIEQKREGQHPSKEQKKAVQRLKSQNYKVIISHSAEQTIELLKTHISRSSLHHVLSPDKKYAE